VQTRGARPARLHKIVAGRVAGMPLRGRPNPNAGAPAADRSDELTRVTAERDLLRLQLESARESERSVVAELHRLRALGFARAHRDQPQPHYLFVLSVGRTGSTLVQGVLNSVPGVVIRGENGGLLLDLYHLHAKALHHRDRLARTETLLSATHPWWGMDGYPEDLALREFRHLATDLLLRPPAGAHTVGFKEISWPDGEVQPFVDFLRDVFPGARFVLSTRRLEDVATSGFWANRADAMPRLTALDASVRAAMSGLGSDALVVDYDDIDGRPDGFRPLFDWLGLAFDRDAVAAVVSQPHSYAPRAGRALRPAPAGE
jgi:hypothetical protein